MFLSFSNPRPPVLLLLVLALALVSCSEEEPPQALDVVRPIAWFRAEPFDNELTRHLSGIVQPSEETALSFEVPGKVETVKVRLGDSVKQGQLLAALDTRTFRLEVESTRAALAEAEAVLEEARLDFERRKELLERGVEAKAAFDSATSRYETAKSGVKSARARLNLTLENLGDTRLTAPYDGKITQRMVEPFQQIAAGTPVLLLEGGDGLELDVLAPETIVDQLQTVTTLEVTFPSLPGVTATGRVTDIAPRAAEANAFPVTVTLPDPPQGVRAGMTAEAVFTIKRFTAMHGDEKGESIVPSDAVVVPASAVLAGEGNLLHIFVYNEDSGTLSRRVASVVTAQGNMAVVTKGVRPGEIVAIAGTSFLRDGQKVELLDTSLVRY